jgi:hypothetical protein
MESVSDLRRKYCPTALFVALVIAIVLILSGQRDMARGLVLGTLFSILNFVLMSLSIQLRMQKSQRAGTVMSLMLVLLRFGFLALPLVVSIRYDNYHIATTIAGLFMVQVVMLAYTLRKTPTARA